MSNNHHPANGAAPPNPDEPSILASLAIISLTLCCIPCLCAAGSIVVLRNAVRKIAHYHRPSTLRRMARERAAEEKRVERNTVKRTVPKNVAPRKMMMRGGSGVDAEVMGPKMQSHLTIGRPLDDVQPDLEKVDGFMEGDDLCVKELAMPVEEKATDRQEQSVLFKLPLEIRRQIYKQVIGQYKIHISFNQTYRKMDHKRCRHLGSVNCFDKHCTMYHKQKGAKDIFGQVGLLALLKSCRMVYTEAIDILYQENIFTFPKLGEVLRLSMTLLPERMALIKNLQWRVCYCSPTIHTTTPWLECHAPDDCICVSCMPQQVYSELKIRRWIIYSWMMRSQKADSEAHALDHVSHATR